jgi:hypothetical protein
MKPIPVFITVMALLAALAGSVPAAPAPAAGGASAPTAPSAGRHPLRRLTDQLSVKGPGYSIDRAPGAAEVVIHYREGGRPLQLSYQPPDAVEAFVQASVKPAPGDILTLIYSYRLASSPASRQSIADFVVEFAGTVLTVTAPKSWEPQPLPSVSALDWRSSAELAAGGKAEGFGFATQTIAHTEHLEAPPGGLKGFVHDRGSLPGIVHCYVVGTFKPPAALSTALTPALAPIVAALPAFPRNGLGGRTIGPVALPGEDLVGTLLGRMIQYARASVELGWIERPDTAERYARSLESIRRWALAAKGQVPSDLHYRLEAVERQTDVDWGAGALSSEAYALLKFNSNWLHRWTYEHHD